MGFGEHRPAHGGADVGPYFRFDGGVGAQPEGRVVLGVGAAHPAQVLILVRHDPEGATELGRGVTAGLAQADTGQVLGDVVGVGVQAFPEQGLHLVFADLRPLGDHPMLLDGGVMGVAADRAPQCL
jgi:hypothetical protein